MDDKPSAASFIVIGAGIFSLSPALAISRRLPSAKVTMIDRLTPPVEDSTRVDTTCCIRADYADPVYAGLAAKARGMLEDDPEIRPFYFKQGMTFVWEKGLENVRRRQGAGTLVEMHSHEEVFARIHGSIRVYYERCLKQESISFLCNAPVAKIHVEDAIARGVVLEDGRILEADATLVATGAWSNKLVHLEGLAFPSAIEVAWVKLTKEEVTSWQNMSITTSLSTGFDLFPPYRGEIKMPRRSPGYCNTISVPHPEDPSTDISISYPRTTVTNPGDWIPKEAEKSLRDDLRELMPSLSERPFDRTKLCW